MDCCHLVFSNIYVLYLSLHIIIVVLSTRRPPTCVHIYVIIRFVVWPMLPADVVKPTVWSMQACLLPSVDDDRAYWWRTIWCGTLRGGPFGVLTILYTLSVLGLCEEEILWCYNLPNIMP